MSIEKPSLDYLLSGVLLPKFNGEGKRHSRGLFYYYLQKLEIVKKMKDNNNYYGVILPARPGWELYTARDAKLPEKQLIAIDRDPEVLIHPKWVDDFPKIKKCPGEISEGVGNVLGVNDLIAFASLDLCGNLTGPTTRAFTGFMRSTSFIPEALVSMTIAKGREKGVDITKPLGCKFNLSSERLNYLINLPEISSRVSKVIRAADYKADNGISVMEQLWFTVK